MQDVEEVVIPPALIAAEQRAENAVIAVERRAERAERGESRWKAAAEAAEQRAEKAVEESNAPTPTRLLAAEQRAEILKDELRDARVRMEDRGERLEAAEADRDRLQGERDALRTEKDRLQTDLDETAARAARYATEANDLARQNRILQREFDHPERDKSVRIALDQTRAERGAFRADSDRLRDALRGLVAIVTLYSASFLPRQAKYVAQSLDLARAALYSE